VKVAGIEAVEDLLAHGVSEVELMGTHDVALGADAKEFAFHRVEVLGGVERFFQDRIE